MSGRGLIRNTLKDWTLTLGGPDLKARLQQATPPTNEYGVDAFGFSPEFALEALAPLLWLYRKYFRVEAHGLENIPAGRVLLISNHSGQIPFDAAMIATACLVDAPTPRVVRGMAEKWISSLPFASILMFRGGTVVGTPENCRRLLASGEAIMAFPEGVKGVCKVYSQRYKLQPFGHGFMRLALETKTPIVPVAVVGAEEQMPAFADIKPLARMIGFPAAPLVLNVLPLPTKYRIYFGKPLSFKGDPNDEDEELQGRVESVREAITGLIQRGLKERKGIFR